MWSSHSCNSCNLTNSDVVFGLEPTVHVGKDYTKERFSANSAILYMRTVTVSYYSTVYVLLKPIITCIHLHSTCMYCTYMYMYM